MTTAASHPPRMTTDEFLVWAEGVEGQRVELVDGEVFSMVGGTKRNAALDVARQESDT